ncbi:hypothetical protein K439DRAFT_895733 [Ramaria rubella]|nr:hypothetical protein K439DRAFT_895733 [Ramaria rubella]
MPFSYSNRKTFAIKARKNTAFTALSLNIFIIAHVIHAWRLFNSFRRRRLPTVRYLSLHRNSPHIST